MVKRSVTHFKMQRNVATTTFCDTFVTSTYNPLLQVMAVTHLLLSSLLSVPEVPKLPANTVRVMCCADSRLLQRCVSWKTITVGLFAATLSN